MPTGSSTLRLILSRLLLSALLSFTALATPVPQLNLPRGQNRYLVVSHDGRRLAVLESTRVAVWDVDRRKLLHMMQGFSNVTDVKFSPDGRTIVVSDLPRWVGCFDCGDDFRKRWEFRGSSSGLTRDQAGAYFAQFSPNGKYLLLSGGSHGRTSNDQSVRLMDSASGKVLREYPKWGDDALAPWGLKFAPDSQGFVRSYQKGLAYFTLPGGNQVREIQVAAGIVGLMDGSQGIECHLTGTSNDFGRMNVYSWPDLRLLEERLDPAEADPRQTDGPLSWSRPGGKLQVSSGETVIYQGGPTEYVRTWVSGGGFILGSHEKADGYPHLRDARGQQLTGSGFDTVNAQGTMAIVYTSRNGDKLSIYDLRAGAQIDKFTQVESAEFSGDGRRLAIILEKGVLVLDIAATLEQGKLVALP